MEDMKERRREERLRHQWPIWFAEDFKENVYEGLMVDVSSGGLAFTCKADETCPYPSQNLIMRFSIPRYGQDDPTAMTSFTRTGSVLRVDVLDNHLCRIAIMFDEQLSLKPCEQAAIEMMRRDSAG
jgi:hypothetical protein